MDPSPRGGEAWEARGGGGADKPGGGAGRGAAAVQTGATRCTRWMGGGARECDSIESAPQPQLAAIQQDIGRRRLERDKGSEPGRYWEHATYTYNYSSPANGGKGWGRRAGSGGGGRTWGTGGCRSAMRTEGNVMRAA